MSASNAHWLEIAVPVATDAAEEVAAQLAMAVDAAQSGIWVKDQEIVFWVDAKDVRVAAEQTRAFARSLGSEAIVREAQPESEWRDAWKKYFKTTRITRQLVIVPSWDTFYPGPADLVLNLDPGQAFGTGDHASTKLILTALQALKDSETLPRRILDVGTGSGILALAAARLWPGATGIAVDCDPLAVSCARQNFEQNGVDRRFVTATTDVSEIHESFDLVLANIQADVLCTLSNILVARVSAGGCLILSGLLTEQIPDVCKVYEGLGLCCETNQPDAADPQWSALVFVQP